MAFQLGSNLNIIFFVNNKIKDLICIMYQYVPSIANQQGYSATNQVDLEPGKREDIMCINVNITFVIISKVPAIKDLE